MATDFESNFKFRFLLGCKNDNLEEVRSAMEEYESCMSAKSPHKVKIKDYQLPHYYRHSCSVTSQFCCAIPISAQKS